MEDLISVDRLPIMTSRSIFKHSAFKFTEFDAQILVKLPGFLQGEVH